MSITSALLSSRSGLAVAGTRAGIASENIANAGRTDYVRRNATLSSQTTGGGVEVSSIRRDVDGALQTRERSDRAQASYNQTLSAGLALYTDRLGEMGTPAALPARIAALQSDLDLMAGTPAATGAQRSFLNSAEELVRGITGAATALGAAQDDALSGLRNDLTELNALLRDVAEMNATIGDAAPGTPRRATAEDARDAALDRITEYADVTVLRQADGRIDVIASGGAALVEGTETHALSFDATTGTLRAGEVDVTPGRAGVRGVSAGSLSARVDLVTEVLPGMSRQLDGLAAALVTTFEGADASLGAGQAGLFTDAGAAYDPAAREGLAERLAVNDAVRPDAGGALWRLRDGIGAAAEGAASDPTQVLAFVGALESAQSFDPADGLGASNTLADYAAVMVSEHNVATSEAGVRAESYAASAAAIAHQRSSTEGVNVDTELQDLLSIEQSYAANSQVISALTRMMDTLLEAV
ncbi:flagellar hook-associated protein FlgK (plasmid) [Roseivivax marinus]|uniref:flagellar hook-associated protein FlgK n=1 Tax=Roseivivax marinus TaxID=1379903 RepID=UPI001F03C8A2|nr:flagellar hook-associated protein FlgK [Roseivivax marinus]UMA66874.1 flagellar hook-associated protein FlgK [Roseivivax marinus]